MVTSSPVYLLTLRIIALSMFNHVAIAKRRVCCFKLALGARPLSSLKGVTELICQRFLIWQLRTSYLTYNKDGVGERLISLDPSKLLSDPSIRNAGYGARPDIQRTYSPPIPVATGVASEYFAGPSKAASFGIDADGEAELEGGMVTGKGSADTVGPGPQARRRRRQEQQEDDDSSDLSDDSDDEPDSRYL